jgi:diguanylate cyclase (GGDEF)-like protein
MRQFRILFLAANPDGTSKIALDEEIREIEAKLRGARFGESIALRSRWAVHADDLIQSLNEDVPSIVHFSAHGTGAPGIFLHSETGEPKLISGDQLRRVFSTFQGGVSVVVLNACYSEVQAHGLIQAVDFVIAMNDTISDHAARKFSGSFYRALAFGATVKNAFDQGLLSVALEEDDETQAAIPHLLHRPEVDPDETVLVSIDSRQPRENLFRLEGEKDAPGHESFDLVSSQAGRDFLEHSLNALAQRNEWESFTIALIDIDHLTVINKHFNRLVGSRVLARVGELIARFAQPDWYVGRCGDDTFYQLMPDVGLVRAMEICAAVKDRIKAFDWDSVARDLRVTCSIGLARRKPEEPAYITTVRAGYGFQDAKKAGGNIVRFGPEFLRSHMTPRLDEVFS